MRDSMKDRIGIGVTAAVSLIITLLICWHWNINVLNGDRGVHGGWGFEIWLIVTGIGLGLGFVVKKLMRKVQKS